MGASLRGQATRRRRYQTGPTKKTKMLILPVTGGTAMVAHPQQQGGLHQSRPELQPSLSRQLQSTALMQVPETASDRASRQEALYFSRDQDAGAISSARPEVVREFIRDEIGSAVDNAAASHDAQRIAGTARSRQVGWRESV